MQGGITIQFKYRSGAEESEENIQGVSFRKGNYSFKGSEIDRKFSHGNLKKALSANLNEAWGKMKDMIMPEATRSSAAISQERKPTIQPMAEGVAGIRTADAPMQRKEPKPVERPKPDQKPATPAKRNPLIGGIRLTDEQIEILQKGDYVFLENMEKKDGSGKFSAYVFTDLDMKRAFYSAAKPDEFVKYGQYEMRLMDKRRIEKGYLTRAKVRWHGSGNFAHPYLWKTPGVKGESYKESWDDPRIPEHIRQQKREKEEKQRRRQIVIPPKKNGPKLG